MSWLDRLARLDESPFTWPHGRKLTPAEQETMDSDARRRALWPLLVATIQAAEKLRVAYTDVSPADEEGLAHPAELRRLWAAVDEANSRLGYSLELLRAEVEKLP